MKKTAIITGITGQDGSYLSELLLSKGYEVHGFVRRSSTFNTSRIDHIFQDQDDPNTKLFLHYWDLTNLDGFANIIKEIQPTEFYHLAAQSHVGTSFDMPVYTGDVTGLGTARVLETIRQTGIETKFYQGSSSEMFGNAPAPQNEETPFQPLSPYACAKMYSYWMTLSYRKGHGIFASNGILFNHESPRRGETFVTRKITRALARILAGQQQKLYLGNLEAKRDWGFAPDYVEAMWLILQNDNPDDFVIGTGVAHSVRDFLDIAFSYVGLNWKNYVEFNERYTRPNEVNCLIADTKKARSILGWKPKYSFNQLVTTMVDADIKLLSE